MSFYKYKDSPTVYTDQNKALPDKAAYIAAGGKGDFSDVQNLDQVTPTLLNQSSATQVPKLGDVPAVYDSSSVAQDFQDQSQKLDKLSGTQQTTGQTGNNSGSSTGLPNNQNFQNPDGSKTPSGTTTTTAPKSPAPFDSNAYYDSEIAKGQADVDAYKADATARRAQERDTSIAQANSWFDTQSNLINQKIDTAITAAKRTGQLNIDRRKAYGLGNASYDPLGYTDAVTEAETAMNNSINDLESQRQSLLSQAQQARDQGEAQALTNFNNQIEDIDNKARTIMQQTQSKITNDINRMETEYEKQKKEYDDARSRLVQGSTFYLDNFDQAQTKEDKEKLVENIIEANGWDANTPGLALDIYSTLSSASVTRKRQAMEDEGKQLDLNQKRLDAQYAPAEKALDLKSKQLDIAKKAQDLGNGGTGNFTSEEKRKLEQANLLNAPRQQQLDFLYGGKDSTKEADYTKATDFIKANPDATQAEIKTELMKSTKLGSDEINTLLDSQNVPKDRINLTDSTVSDVAKALVKSYGNVQDAKNSLTSARKIKVTGGKEVALTSAQVDSITKKMDELYPSGKRSFWDKVLPGGK